jgi:hypothetical protein
MPPSEGFVFESPQVDMEIYRLLTMVLASQALAECARSPNGGLRLEWLRKIEVAEVSRALVSLAAIVRTGLARGPVGSIELQRPVGLLYEGPPTASKPADLTLREACNKILHADVVDPEVRDEGPELGPSLTRRINLYGQHRGRDWRAVLDVVSFSIAAVYFT